MATLAVWRGRNVVCRTVPILLGWLCRMALMPGAVMGALFGRCPMPQNQWTPLHWAANKGHVDVVRLLLETGADIEAADKVGGARGLGWKGSLVAAMRPCT